MAQLFHIHPEHPQPRLVRQAVEIARSGGLLALPTDAAYCLAGVAGHAPLLDRIKTLRGVDDRHHFTLMCRDLSEISTYAKIDNTQFRLLKATTPGPYTFILEGSRQLPRRLLQGKARTVGIRVPDSRLVQALLEELGEPLLCSTLIPADEEAPLVDVEDIRDRYEKRIDLIVDCGHCGTEFTTVVNLAGGEAVLVRAGKGALGPLGLT